jgi:enoyl-CoA hydratase
MKMEYKDIIFEKSGHVAIITLNRPKALNAVTTGVLIEIGLAMDEIEADENIGALVVTGGEKIFAAGFDIKELATVDTAADASHFLKRIQPYYNRLATLSVPVIAATSGLTFGGGFELALCCDFRIASDTAKFALPEITLGLIPGAGGTQRLPRIIGLGRANEMIFSGTPISAKKAFAIGLVNEIVSPETLLETAIKKAEMLASRPGYAITVLKNVIQTGLNTDLQSGLEYEARCFEMLFSTHDKKEGVAAFVEKRKPEFKGC